MATQTEMRNEVSYENLARVAGALDCGDDLRGVYSWRERWAADAMNALGIMMREMMDRRGCKAWELGGKRHSRLVTEPGATITPHPEHADAVQINEPNGSSHEYGRPWYKNANNQDPEDIAGSVLWPDMYVHCQDCKEVLSTFAVNDFGGCSCGAKARSCESDCFEVGGDVCFHHGAPTIPNVLLEEHGYNFEAAAATLVDDPHTRAVFQAAARPGGIWEFPGGHLHGEQAGS